MKTPAHYEPNQNERFTTTASGLVVAVAVAVGVLCAYNKKAPEAGRATKSEISVEARLAVPAKPARKFKIGDCVSNTRHLEEWESNPPRRIAQIGSESYFAPSADNDREYTFETLSFYSMEDGSFVKVRCPR